MKTSIEAEKNNLKIKISNSMRKKYLALIGEWFIVNDRTDTEKNSQ